MAKVMSIMKKIMFLAAAMVAAMTACVKEADVDTPIETPQEEEKVWVEFTAGAETKAAIKEGDGNHQIVWEEDDQISINGEIFDVTELTESNLKATFGAFVPANFTAPYKAVYPASAGKTFEDLDIASTPSVVAAGFDDIVAVAYSEDACLQFKHVTSLIKFQVPADFTVNEVTISADEALRGNVNVVMEAEDAIPAIDVTSETKKISLTGTFVSGTNYYIPVLPGEKTNLTVSFNNGLFEVWQKDVEIKQGRVANMGTLSAPDKSEFALIGSHNNTGDWNNDDPMYKTTEDNFYVSYGVTFTADGSFKIRKTGEWNDDFNFGTTNTDAKAANSIVGVYTDGGSKDINVKAGTYDIYFDRLAGQVYIMAPGKSYEEVQQPTTTSYYSLAGSFAGGGWDDTVAMKYSGDGIWTNVQTFASNDLFKIKIKGGWSASWGADNVYPGNGLVTKDNDGNAKVTAAGTYIIGFYKEGNKITLVKK